MARFPATSPLNPPPVYADSQRTWSPPAPRSNAEEEQRVRRNVRKVYAGDTQGVLIYTELDFAGSLIRTAECAIRANPNNVSTKLGRDPNKTRVK